MLWVFCLTFRGTVRVRGGRDTLKIIFAGGGTAGHVNPALALAELMREGNEILFVGTPKGMEETLVPKAGFDIKYIDVLGLRRRISFQNVRAFFKVFKAFAQSKKIIREFKPDVVIGTGGYVAGPLLYAAARMKIPTLIHEQNVFAGLTSKILQKYVDVVAISFKESEQYFTKAKKLVYTGNILRSELFDVNRKQAVDDLGIDNKPMVLAFGGSLGAEGFNDAVVKFIKDTSGRYNILFSTGERYYEDIVKELNGIDTDRIKIKKYIHNMQVAMNAADIVIARAGAITVSELTALGKPSVLVPSPNVTNNHQEYNARALEKCGAAIVILERELAECGLTETVNNLFENVVQLVEMSESALSIGVRDGAKQVIKLIEDLV